MCATPCMVLLGNMLKDKGTIQSSHMFSGCPQALHLCEEGEVAWNNVASLSAPEAPDAIHF